MKRPSRAQLLGQRPRRRLGTTALALLTTAIVAAATPSAAQAGEVTRATYTGEEKNKFDLHFGVQYSYDFKRAAILREWNTSDGGAGGTGETQLARDLIYRQQRHTVTPMVEIGLYRGLSIYSALPIIVADNRDYGFDQDASDCVYPNEVGTGGNNTATCVDKTNSSTIRDGIVPIGGYDASASNPFANSDLAALNTELIFRGPTRRGIDQVHVGIKYAVLAQRYRSHMPTWIIAFEGRFAAGQPMTMQRTAGNADPSGNSRVGRGIHELGFWTAMSRRFRYLEPYWGGHWRYAFGGARSEFKDFGGAQTRVGPLSTAGMFFGTEIIPWEVNEGEDGERAKSYRKFSILMHGSADYMYGGNRGGREYSEVWELLADSPAMVGSNRPGDTSFTCDRNVALAYAAANPGDPSGYIDEVNTNGGNNNCTRNNGISTVQDYANFGLTAALNFHIGPYARLNFGADLKTTTRHFLTSASRGEAGRSTAGNPNLVDQPSEINPTRRDVVDSVGRRYAIDDVMMVRAFLNFILTF